jgi:NADP-dependent 3-hydroxy acid dehydrogenase YdfG
MRRSLTDCTAVVTGATGGIGQAIARALAAEGARVVLVGRDETRLRAAAESLRGPACPVVLRSDLGDEQSIALLTYTVQQQLGAVHVLVHAAGAITLGRFQDLSVETLDTQYRLNVRAPFLITQALLPLILASRGQVVFVNSSAGLNARAGVSQYAASKHALKALADSLREEVHGAGVRVLSVFPGRTATPMQRTVRAMEGQAYESESYLQPEDIASAVVCALTLPDTAEVKDISMRPMRD